MSNKPIVIDKQLVMRAWKLVAKNAGAAGIDKQSIEDFSKDLKNNLYKLWNRMSSGSYFPPPVRGVEIPKRQGGKRLLGVPSVGDRVAQTVVKLLTEADLEAIFHDDSYGYRPGRSCHDALEITRRRCWRYNWVVEYDIKGLFDNIDHDLLLKAVKKHIPEPWMVMYIERWLKVDIVLSDGTVLKRTKGVPQGGVISPLLANLFLHYAIDMWAVRTIPDIPFCRYADDGLLHCVTEKQAHFVLGKLKSRLKECGLEINQSKSRIVYCKDANRKNEEEITKFDFLGYEFKGRLSRTKSKDGFFIGFNPAISSDRLKSLVHAVKYELKALRLTNISLQDVARSINPIVRGWLNYYGKFNPSMLERVVKAINRRLAHWARSKFKSLKRSMAKAWVFINKVRINSPKMFAHWDYYRSLTGAG